MKLRELPGARSSLFHHLRVRGGGCRRAQPRGGMRSCRCSCSQAGFGNACCVERTVINLLHINSHQQVGLLEGTFSERLNGELCYC